MQVRVASAEEDSREIEALLREVYVGGGFTEAAPAETLFAASAVFARGRVLVARDPATRALAGMIILVPADSPARRLAGAGEAELHLLAVAAGFRRRGVGDLLVRSALDLAREGGVRRILLWTQPSMTDAQRLYARLGFERAAGLDFDQAGRRYLVYETSDKTSWTFGRF